jgi:hypothetical protein
MGKTITATRPDNHRTLPCAEEISAMGQRNRAALDKARAEGAKTWLSEEFNCAGDGVMRRAWREVPVPEFDDGDWKQKFTADDGTASYDQDAIREALRTSPRPSRSTLPLCARSHLLPAVPTPRISAPGVSLKRAHARRAKHVTVVLGAPSGARRGARASGPGTAAPRTANLSRPLPGGAVSVAATFP